MSDDGPSSGAPRRLGRYEIVAEIARGGMGTVFLARHAGEAGFQRLFAIKLMHPHLAEDRQFVDMLLDEARIAARIHHPNVVAIVDLGHGDSGYFVVLEYVDGAAFSALLGRNKESRPPQLIVPIVIDALDGLAAAHSLIDDDGRPLHLVHRDVSPQNILVGADGVGRITDFGIAKAEARITSTQPGMRKGKIHYMAPEQLTEDGENIDLRADVFAAGAVLWSALTGQPLFRGANDAATIHNVLTKEIPPPSTVGLSPPAAFDAVCLRALERDPDKRFSSALEMADALRRAAAAHGLVSSRKAIAAWVSETLGDKLDARRQAVRALATRSQPPGAAESLPELPALHGPLSAASLNPSSEPPSSTQRSELVPVPPQGTSTSHSLSVAPMGAPRFARRRAALVGGLLLLPVAIGAIWLATRPSGAESEPVQSASTALPPASHAEIAPGPSENTTPTTTPGGTEPEVPVSALSAAPPAPKAPWHAPRHSKPPTKTRPPTPKPKASSAPTPTPTPRPTAGIQFENNPYLRKK